MSASYDTRNSAIYVQHYQHGQEKATHRREYHIGRIHIIGALFDVAIRRTWETTQ